MSIANISPENFLQPEKEDDYSILNCSLSFIGKKEKEIILVRENESNEQYKIK